MSIDCKACESPTKKKATSGTSLLSALLVVIIPKCSICVMAYSSAIALCGGEAFYHAENNWVSYIPIALSMLIVGLIIKNWRGNRSTYALILSIIGLAMIILSHQLIIDSTYYNIGSALLFVAVWFNSNLLHTIQLFRSKMTSKEIHA